MRRTPPNAMTHPREKPARVTFPQEQPRQQRDESWPGVDDHGGGAGIDPTLRRVERDAVDGEEEHA
jgi:hypothetical protein